MDNLFQNKANLKKPGLFITGTDTEVGKTVVACAIAWALMRGDRNLRIGVSKPFASGCELKRGQLFNRDALALAHFSQCRQPMGVINPVRFRQPLAPAAAAEVDKVPVDFPSIANSLKTLDVESNVILVEGIGGLMVPLDPNDPQCTVLDFAKWLGYPVLVVARAQLGTLNHTAMTITLLQQVGCTIAGVVINGYDPADANDPSITGNAHWITKMTGVPVLAQIPQLAGDHIMPHEGRLPQVVLDEVAQTHWLSLFSPSA